MKGNLVFRDWYIFMVITMIVMGMYHFDKSRRSKMVNNYDEIKVLDKDMASKGCRKALASAEDDFNDDGIPSSV